MDHEKAERLGMLKYGLCALAYTLYQLSNDPTLSSLPLLSTFLKSYSLPYLGISPPTSTKQISAETEPGTLSSSTQASHANGDFPELINPDDELVEQEIRDRLKKMCEGYFDNVSKKLLIEHKVSTKLRRRFIDLKPLYSRSGYKNKIGAITRRTYVPARFSKTVSKRTRR